MTQDLEFAVSPNDPETGPIAIPDDLDADSPLSTGDMARMSGSTLRTVRFYESEGLIAPVGRSDGGRRQFARSELEKLRLALDLREAGLSIHEIKELFELKQRFPDPRKATAEVSEILNRQVDAMQRKIATLRRLREELATMVTVISECGLCEGSRWPNHCQGCDVLKHDPLPRAVRVLWE